MATAHYRAFRRFFGRGALLKQVVTLLSGTASAQLVTMLSMVPLARLYTPQDLGFYAILMAIVSFGVGIAALRYDITVVLPENDADAWLLHVFARRTIAVSAGVVSVAIFALYPVIRDSYENASFARWLIISGVIVFIMAQITNIQFWLTRKQLYRAIALNRLTQASLVAFFQLLFALNGAGFQGLFLGLALGQSIALLAITIRLRRTMGVDKLESSLTMSKVAFRYRKMPLLNGPNVLLDSVKTSGINLLIGNIAMGGLGQFSLAFQMTKAPVRFLSAAVSQVLLQRLARIRPGGMLKFLTAAYIRLFAFAAPVFVIFYFIAPFIFPTVFGAQWAQAGLFSQALVPWLFMLTFTSPLSSLFVVTEKQELSLVFAAVTTVTALGFLIVSPMELLETVRWLSLIMAGLLLCWVFVAIAIARKFDNRPLRE